MEGKMGIPFPLQQQRALIWLPGADLPLRVDICNIRSAKQSRNIYISWKWVKVKKLSKKNSLGWLCHDKVGNIRLAKQSRNIYIFWMWVKVQKLSQKMATFFWMADGKEGRTG